jgi:hypothetical protein
LVICHPLTFFFTSSNYGSCNVASYGTNLPQLIRGINVNPDSAPDRVQVREVIPRSNGNISARLHFWCTLNVRHRMHCCMQCRQITNSITPNDTTDEQVLHRIHWQKKTRGFEHEISVERREALRRKYHDRISVL